MLRRFKIKNFRLLRDIELDLTSRVPLVLVGPNATGKTSVLDALHLLGQVTSPNGLVQALRLRGGPDLVRTSGCNEPLELAVEIDDGGEEVRSQVDYGFRLSVTGGIPVIEEEWLKGSRHGLLNAPVDLLSRQGQRAKLYNQVTGEIDEIGLANPTQLALAEVRQATYYRTLDMVRDTLENMTIYAAPHTAPAWLRDPREANIGPRESTLISRVDKLDGRSIDLVARLYNLREDQKKEWDLLQRQFRTEFPHIENLDFPVDLNAGRIALGYTDRRFPGRRLYGQQMSDGMLAFLSVLTAALPTRESTLIGFDEPEAHLHPSALRSVVSCLEIAAENHPVVIATHSELLLDFLSEPTKSLHICTADDQGVTIEQLDPQAMSAWLASYRVSELRRQGHLDTNNRDQLTE